MKRGGQTQGKNIDRQKLKVQRLYQKFGNIRNDHIDKTIAEIVKTKPSYITIADIDLMYLMKNRYVTKAMGEQKLRHFRNKLTSKCHELGIELRIAEKTYRSASICSKCGKMKTDPGLSSDKFKCDCGFYEDRSLNASYNLRDTKIHKMA
jgi:putative transposase